MQDDLNSHFPSADIQILGVNEAGFDGNNDGFTDGRDLPWLQDVDADNNGVSDVWYDSWGITYRDVVVLDADNEISMTFNVTANSLAVSSNYTTLRNAFADAIKPDAKSEWQNPFEPLQVDDDGFIGPLDALLTVNALSQYPDGKLPSDTAGSFPYLDVTGDGLLTPLDPLRVINQLTTNSQTNSALRSLPTASSSAAVTSDFRFVTTRLETATRPSEDETRVDAVMSDYSPAEDWVDSHVPDLPSHELTMLYDPLYSQADTDHAESQVVEDDFGWNL